MKMPCPSGGEVAARCQSACIDALSGAVSSAFQEVARIFYALFSIYDTETRIALLKEAVRSVVFNG